MTCVNDIPIIRPPKCADKIALASHEPTFCGYFDGGAVKRCSTGGFLIYNHGGALLHTEACYYEEYLPTNNAAKMQSLVDLLDWASNNISPIKTKKFLVMGDLR